MTGIFASSAKLSLFHSENSSQEDIPWITILGGKVSFFFSKNLNTSEELDRTIDDRSSYQAQAVLNGNTYPFRQLYWDWDLGTKVVRTECCTSTNGLNYWTLHDVCEVRGCYIGAVWTRLLDLECYIGVLTTKIPDPRGTSEPEAKCRDYKVVKEGATLRTSEIECKIAWKQHI